MTTHTDIPPQILILWRRPLAPPREINIDALVLLLAAEGDVLPGREVLRLRRRQRRRDQLGERVLARRQKDRQDDPKLLAVLQGSAR